MKRFKRFLSVMLVGAVCLACAACGSKSSIKINDYASINGKLTEDKYVTSGEYDKNLFYRNIGTITGADPFVLTDGDTYYLYATNANGIGDCSYLCGWKSKNLTDWESLGKVFVPQRDAWTVSSLWAPEVIKYGDKYYLYYSGYNVMQQDEELGNDKKLGMGIGVAVADNPAGPFKEISGTTPYGTYTHTKSPFNFGFKAIDASPFVDPDTGKIYLYVSQDQVNRTSSVYACELYDDMVTVKPGTLTQTALVKPSQSWESPTKTSKWNEAPHMLKYNGKYYLFYSANYYQSSAYAVGIAVSDDPLSGFVKVDYNPILQAFSDWSYTSGTGHCSIFKSPDGTEYWMAYHSHIDVINGGSERKINFDRITFDADGRLYVNGPSITPQALPSGTSEYKNVAGQATVTASNGDDVSKLTDGIINYYYNKNGSVPALEYQPEGKVTLTFTFDKAMSVHAVMVYDSADYYLSAKTVAMTIGKEKIGALKFNPNFTYVDEYGWENKIPGSAAMAEFAPITTTKVTVTLEADAAYNEIVILAKEVAV